MRLAALATIAATSSVALADPNSWGTWQPVTTTVTMTLLHVSNQTVTSTSYSHSSTGTAPRVFANTTSSTSSSSFYKPALTTPQETPTTAATVASFSTGAAVAPQANIAIAGLLGMGAVAYGLL